VSKKQSHEWQKLADVPEEQFEARASSPLVGNRFGTAGAGVGEEGGSARRSNRSSGSLPAVCSSKPAAFATASSLSFNDFAVDETFHPPFHGNVSSLFHQRHQSQRHRASQAAVTERHSTVTERHIPCLLRLAPHGAALNLCALHGEAHANFSALISSKARRRRSSGPVNSRPHSARVNRCEGHVTRVNWSSAVEKSGMAIVNGAPQTRQADSHIDSRARLPSGRTCRRRPTRRQTRSP
jgi:hypothetical protein